MTYLSHVGLGAYLDVASVHLTTGADTIHLRVRVIQQHAKFCIGTKNPNPNPNNLSIMYYAYRERRDETMSVSVTYGRRYMPSHHARHDLSFTLHLLPKVFHHSARENTTQSNKHIRTLVEYNV